jgi:hypothetical protein
MIDNPVVGMVVRVDKQCCGGHEEGTTGTITSVDFKDSFVVTALDRRKHRDLWHCTQCVSELAEKEAQR